MRRISDFFKPERSKFILFALFIIIYLGARIQAWCFMDDMPNGPPKPFFYDQLRLVPFWLVFVYLSLPVMGILKIFSISPDSMAIPIYFYFLSCLLIEAFRLYKTRLKREIWIWIALGPMIFFILLFSRSGITSHKVLGFLLHGLISFSLVGVLYGYLCVCGVFFIWDIFTQKGCK